MSVFNPDQFMQQEVTGQLDTSIIPVPQGDYPATITKVAARQVQGKDGGTSTILDVTWEVADEGVKKVTKREKSTVRQSVFLDITGQGSIDMSKGANVQLGALRDVLKQNWKDKPWNPNMLMGKTARIIVEHKPNDAAPESPYANVKKAVAL